MTTNSEVERSNSSSTAAESRSNMFFLISEKSRTGYRVKKSDYLLFKSHRTIAFIDRVRLKNQPINHKVDNFNLYDKRHENCLYMQEEGGWFGYNNLIKWSTASSGECGEKKILK